MKPLLNTEDRYLTLTAKVILLIVFCLLIYFFPPIILLTLPGILFFFNNDLELSLTGKTVYSAVISLSYWITSFWLLKYIPLTFTDLFYLTALISLPLFIIAPAKSVSFVKNVNTDIRNGLFLFLILATFIPVFSNNLAPAGADMATHSYIARHISETGGFPKTYEPILPINKFGSSYLGMSVLIAYLSRLGDFAVNESGLIITVLTYFLFSASVYLFLTNKFSPLVSFLTTLTVIWLGNSVIFYALWGGNPTILSIAFLYFSLNLLTGIIKRQKFYLKYSFYIALIISAGFETQQIPFAVLIYFVIFLIATQGKLLTKYYSNRSLNFALVTGLITFLMLMPSLLNLNFPDNYTISWIRSWGNFSELSRYYVNLADSIFAVDIYLREKIGYSFLIVFTAGILLTMNGKSEEKNYHIAAIITALILLLNSTFWLLPVSYILVPDRVITVLSISLAYFVAGFYAKLTEGLNTHFKSLHPFSLRFLFYSITIYFLALFFIYDPLLKYNYFYKEFNTKNPVEQSDLNVFNWIGKNTSSNEIFLNNYGDAGIWIPALAYRKIINNDTTPFEYYEITEKSKNLKPTYLFVGSKASIDAIYFKNDEIRKSDKFLEVYHSGNSYLYKILEK